MQHNLDLKRLEILETALSLLGTKEYAGAANNDEIVSWFETIGSTWFTDDAVPHCAAFVGHCIELNGVDSTRSAAARSYEDWGEEISLDEAQPGDIIVFWRISPESTSGHVAFFLNKDPEGDYVHVLGANQKNNTTVAKYLESRIVSIRRINESNIRI